MTHNACGELMRVNMARVNSIDQRTRAPAMCASTLANRHRPAVRREDDQQNRSTSDVLHPDPDQDDRRGDELASARAVLQQQQFLSPGDGTNQLLTS